MTAPPRLPIEPEAARADDVPETETRECPSCGTPYEPYQEYCLECGARLPTPAGAPAPWRPGGPADDWALPVLFALVVAVLATAVVLGVQAARDTSTVFRGTPATTDVGTSVPTTDTAPEAGTQTTPTAPTTPTGTTPTTTGPPRPQTVTDWPAGRTGYTVILASIPESGGRTGALAFANRALKAGLPHVGVLRSSRFASLHPGYYVVFSGIYATPAPAERGRLAARDRGYTGYVRQITS